MAKKDRTPNDQRSTVKNPTSKEFELDMANREALSTELLLFGHLLKEKEFPKKKEK